MEIKKIMFNGKEVDFVVSINKEYIEKNDDEFFEDTIILNDIIEGIRKDNLVGETYE